MNDIETLLRDSSRQTLDLPAADILRRGDRIRRRRRGAKAVAAVAAFSLVGIGAYVAIPDRMIDSDVATPAPPPEKNPVGWSGEPTNLTPEELDKMSERCLSTAWADKEQLYNLAPGDAAPTDDLYEEIPAGTWPFLAEKRGSTVRAIFDGDDYEVTCSAPSTTGKDDSEPDFALAYGTPQVWGRYASMGPWEDFSRSAAAGSAEFMLPLPEDLNVTKVVFTSHDEEFPATIVNGVAVAWIDHEVDVEAASFRAYDADGDLVHGEAPPPPTVEWTETAEGIRVTRSLGNETLESAWFWVGEQRFDATIDEDNVAVALIPAGTLTPRQLDKLQIQGLSPDGLYLMGCNGGHCGP